MVVPGWGWVVVLVVCGGFTSMGGYGLHCGTSLATTTYLILLLPLSPFWLKGGFVPAPLSQMVLPPALHRGVVGGLSSYPPGNGAYPTPVGVRASLEKRPGGLF